MKSVIFFLIVAWVALPAHTATALSSELPETCPDRPGPQHPIERLTHILGAPVVTGDRAVAVDVHAVVQEGMVAKRLRREPVSFLGVAAALNDPLQPL